MITNNFSASGTINGNCPILGDGFVTCKGSDGILKYICSPSGGTKSLQTACDNHIYDRPCGNIRSSICPSTKCHVNENLYVCGDGVSVCGITKEEAMVKCNTNTCEEGQILHICPGNNQTICVDNNLNDKDKNFKCSSIHGGCVEGEEIKRCPNNDYVCGLKEDNTNWLNYCPKLVPTSSSYGVGVLNEKNNRWNVGIFFFLSLYFLIFLFFIYVIFIYVIFKYVI